MKEFIQKVINIQSELKAPKSKFNSFGKYNYRSCEDILEAVKPLCAKYGLLLILSDEPITEDGWHYVKATAKLTDGDHEVTATAIAREADDKKGMDPSQVSGTASSYARKYCLNGLLCIDDTKDADTDENHNEREGRAKASKKPVEQKPEGQYPNGNQKNALIRRANKLHIEITDVLKQTGWTEETALTMEQFEKAEIILDEIEASRSVA